MTGLTETADATQPTSEFNAVLVSNLMCLARYLLPPDDRSLSEAELTEMVEEEKCLHAPTRTMVLRFRLIERIIEIHREALTAELSKLRFSPDQRQLNYSSLPRLGSEYPPSTPCFSLLHRLILVMRLREQYSVRGCSLLLQTSDAVTEEVFQHAISRL